MKLKVKILVALHVIFPVLFSCTKAKTKEIYQISTIGALMQGVYQGWIECGALKQKGDFGIGTFEAVDGEMIQIGNKIYKVHADGVVTLANDSEKSPLVVTTFFQPDRNATLAPGMNYTAIQTQLDSLLPNANSIYAIRISGEFPFMKTRSLPRQTQPYPPLVEVAKNQKVFEFHNIRGTLVGFRFPTYLQDVMVTGYHMHFISDDRKSGGHVLDFEGGALNLSAEEASSLNLEIPNGQAFQNANLTNAVEDIGTVEKNPTSQK